MTVLFCKILYKLAACIAVIMLTRDRESPWASHGMYCSVKGYKVREGISGHTAPVFAT